MEQHNINNQYSLTKILIIYLRSALPMAILGWIINPIVSPLADFSDNVSFGVTRIFLFTLGLMWLFLLSMIIIYLEYGTININIVKTRLWLQTPLEPKTSKPKLFLLLIPFSILVIVLEIMFSPIQTFLIDFFHINYEYLLKEIY